MINNIYAAIDIGSNAARLLIKKAYPTIGNKPRYEKLLFQRFPLRLGDDVFTMNKIGKVKCSNLIHLLKAYRHLMKIYGVEKYMVSATSAMRDASNSKHVLKKVERKTKMSIQIIDGKDEASMLYASHVEMRSENLPSICAYVDVGGGSTEVTIIKDGEIIMTTSCNIGTVRLLHLSTEDKATLIANTLSTLTEYASIAPSIDIVGSGGNINKLFKLSEHKNKTNLSFTPKQLTEMYNQLNGMTFEERMEEFGLKRDRADVIIPAAEIFMAIAKLFKSKNIYVPNLGLADGMIDLMYMADHPRTDDNLVVTSPELLEASEELNECVDDEDIEHEGDKTVDKSEHSEQNTKE